MTHGQLSSFRTLLCSQKPVTRVQLFRRYMIPCSLTTFLPLFFSSSYNSIVEHCPRSFISIPLRRPSQHQSVTDSYVSTVSLHTAQLSRTRASLGFGVLHAPTHSGQKRRHALFFDRNLDTHDPFLRCIGLTDQRRTVALQLAEGRQLSTHTIHPINH